uniref:Ig-like domain-containing protein n=1 Tax=Strigamia maritima TaxID=126957 RepID=T1JKQ4_STRMM
NRYIIASSGELYLYQVERNDSLRSYRCQTVHQLTNETQASAPARVIVTEPQSSVPPRITHSNPFLVGKQKSNIQIPCVAQGYPVPSYRNEMLGMHFDLQSL